MARVTFPTVQVTGDASAASIRDALATALESAIDEAYWRPSA
jgi:hypothetical protein